MSSVLVYFLLTVYSLIIFYVFVTSEVRNFKFGVYRLITQPMMTDH